MVCIIRDSNVQFNRKVVVDVREFPPSRYCNITIERTQECDLIAADMSDIATGPCYTSLRNGIGTFYIDRVMSRKLLNHVKSYVGSLMSII